MSDKILTHWKKLTNPNYIGSYSLQPGEERVVEFIKVVREMVTGADGKKEECTVAYLKDEKPFILNSTNCKTLTKVFESPFIEQWVGRRCTIFSAKIKAFGEEMEALRIKSIKPPLPELTPLSDKWSGAIAALVDGKVNMNWIKSRYTISKQNEEQLLKETQS